MSRAFLLSPWARRVHVVGKTLLALLLAGGVAHLVGLRMEPGPEQPIPFSHRVHAGDKGIDCLFCHPYADQSQKAGIPPVDKCLLCHQVIITRFPPIRDLQGYYDRGEPVPWRRVNKVADYVFFNHQMHVLRGFDCGRCHGDVRAMDRIKSPRRFTMGFCVDCHRQEGSSTDCYVCHR